LRERQGRKVKVESSSSGPSASMTAWIAKRLSVRLVRGEGRDVSSQYGRKRGGGGVQSG
jgi:hypothetical protein